MSVPVRVRLALSAPVIAAVAVTGSVVSSQPAAAQPTAIVTVARPAGSVTVPMVKKYTMATVKKHNKKTDCWTVVSGSVYKLTKYVKKHPGGSKRIIALCGKDGTSAFRGQHGTGGSPNRTLKKYKIGVLA